MQPTTDAARAIEHMMAEHGTQILRLCCLYLRDASLAEDATQEVFLKAYRSLTSFRGEASERTWLTTIAVNTCRSMLRTPWHRRVDPKCDIDRLPEPACAMEPGDDSILREVLALPPKLREALLLFYYQDLKASEIADVLHVPVPTVQSRLLRAKARLKPRLERWLER